MVFSSSPEGDGDAMVDGVEGEEGLNFEGIRKSILILVRRVE